MEKKLWKVAIMNGRLGEKSAYFSSQKCISKKLQLYSWGPKHVTNLENSTEQNFEYR